METFGEKFGKLVRKYRESEGIDASELAFRALGSKSKRTRISEIETGKVRKPQAKTVNALVDALDISEAELEACRAPNQKDATQATQLEAVTAFAQSLQEKLTAKEKELITAHAAEKSILLQQIEELTRRAKDPEKALAEANETIARLHATLVREGNELGAELLARGHKALADKDFEAADAIFEEIEDREKLAIDRSARAAFARGEIAEQEIRWHDAARHYQRASSLHPTFSHLRQSWDFYWKLGEHQKAKVEIQMLMDAAIIEEGENSHTHSVALSCAAVTHQYLGNFAEAEPLYKQAIEIGKATIGENHPNYAKRLNNLASLYRDMGRLEQADPLLKQAIEIDKATIGENHPGYATHLNNLANLYHDMGRLEQAEPLYKQAIEIGKATIGENHPEYATRLNNLALLYRDMGRLEQAERLFKQAIEIGKATIGEEHPNYAISLNNLAGLYRTMGRLEQAELLYKQAIEIGKATIGENHPEHAKRLNNLALLYLDMGRAEQAAPLFKRAIAIAEAALGPDHRNTKLYKANATVP